MYNVHKNVGAQYTWEMCYFGYYNFQFCNFCFFLISSLSFVIFLFFYCFNSIYNALVFFYYVCFKIHCQIIPTSNSSQCLLNDFSFWSWDFCFFVCLVCQVIFGWIIKIWDFRWLWILFKSVLARSHPFQLEHIGLCLFCGLHFLSQFSF